MHISIPLAAALVATCAVSIPAIANAQTPLEVWQPPAPRNADPAKQVPQATHPAQDGQVAPAPPARAQSRPQAPAQPQPQPRPQEYAIPGQPPADQDRGGFFAGAYAGKGWVFEGVDQTAAMASLGYRWQAGPVALLGIEVAGGRVDDRRYGSLPIPSIDFATVGFNGRFNFGRDSQLFGLVRSGYMTAEENFGGERSDGGYLGLGLGMDFSRTFNATLVYTHYLYFDDYSWNDGRIYYDDIGSADTLMLGVEARF